LYYEMLDCDFDMKILNAKELNPYTTKKMIMKMIDLSFILVNC